METVTLDAPFGGTAASSYGPREHGCAARAFYMSLKTSCRKAV